MDINSGRWSKSPLCNSWGVLILDIIQCKSDHADSGLS